MYRVRTLYLLNPMTPKIQEALNSLIQAIQEETVAQFSSLLAGGQVGNGRSISRAPKARPKGGKRTAEELEAIKKEIVRFVRKNPGLRAEQIAKGLNTTTKELQLPMLALRQDKALKLKGNRRAASYTAV
jgi:hypothetical protein